MLEFDPTYAPLAIMQFFPIIVGPIILQPFLMKLWLDLGLEICYSPK